MDYLPQLFESNRAWAAEMVRRDPDFFSRLERQQKPEYVWIGCADSRVPANEIVGLAPGELFVHRNVANVVRPDDVNCMAVVQYAVEVLSVKHIIVCGHYGCGGVLAALEGTGRGFVGEWLAPLVALRDEHEEELSEIEEIGPRWSRFCELNVVAQVGRLLQSSVVTAAAERGQELDVHGWIYDVRDGLLRDLQVSVKV